MTSKSAISILLNNSVIAFNELISPTDEKQFEQTPNNKWSAGQDLVHLIKLLRIINMVYKIPKPILRILYGINKKEQRSVEELKTLYKNALKGGAKSPNLYIPKPVLFKDKNDLIHKHKILNEAFVKKLNKHSEIQLDYYRVPHPIIGKISLRELAIFTSFHTVHHFELLKIKLQNKYIYDVINKKLILYTGIVILLLNQF